MKLVLSLRGTHINSSPLADYELADIYKEYFPKIDKLWKEGETKTLDEEPKLKHKTYTRRV